MKKINWVTSADLDLHLIADNDSTHRRPVVKRRYGTLVSMLMRTIDLLTSDVGANDLMIATMRMQAAGLSVGNILRPPKDIEEVFGIKSLSFERDAMKKLLAHGVAEAKKLGW